MRSFTDESPDSSAIFSRQPLTVLMRRKTCLLLMLIIAAAFASQTRLWVLRLKINGVQAFSLFKLDIVELRDVTNCPAASGDTANMASASVSRFGMLLFHGAMCHDAAFTASVDMKLRTHEQHYAQDALVISFEEPVKFNGFFFETHDRNATGSHACDPVMFSVWAAHDFSPEYAIHAGSSQQRTHDGATNWQQVGSSTWRYDRRLSSTGRHHLARAYKFEDGHYHSVATTSRIHTFDYRPLWLPTLIIIASAICESPQ